MKRSDKDSEICSVNPSVSCGRSYLSRRGFLGTLSALATASGIGLGAREAFTEGDLAYLGLASFGPQSSARIKSAVIRIPPSNWLGWPGTSYDLEGQLDAYSKAFNQSAQKIGVKLEEEKTPLENDEAVATFIEEIKGNRPEGVLLSIQHIEAWRWIEPVVSTGVQTIVFAPVGTAFMGHVWDLSRRPDLQVISSLETSAVEQAFRFVQNKHIA